jgi:pyruvate/2-oxoglutarate dehydrogenase complex dihydrolipoamide acyltransferase (E2) component
MKTGTLKDLSGTGAGQSGMLNNKKLWIELAFVLLAAIGVYIAYRLLIVQSGAHTVETAQVQTAVARQGDLVVFASGAGSVVPAAEIGIGFEESGTLSELLIRVGDQVQAGQVLARLQTGKTDEEVALAVADAELNVLTAQQALDDIYANTDLDAAQALIDVEDAGQALEDLQNIDLRQAQALQAVTEAEEAVKDAERVYNSVRLPADDNTIATAKAELVLAENKLKDQQEKFDDYANKPDTDLEKANQQLKLSQAQAAYDSALRYYNAVTGTGSELDLESSAADLAAAQAALADA